jgi:hypothetical protein
MPSRVIKVADPHAFPYELGFTPTEPPEGGFSDLVGRLGRLVREISPSSIVVTSASGDPGEHPIIKHMIPNPDGVGSSMLYVRADSQAVQDVAAAALSLQSAVLNAVIPLVENPEPEKPERP